MRDGRQTVTAFGVLADVDSGYPMLLTEMTHADRAAHGRDLGRGRQISARRRAAASWRSSATARSASSRRWPSRRCCGIDTRAALRHRSRGHGNAARNLERQRARRSSACASRRAVRWKVREIITTCTADKQYATILTDNMVGAGVHINAIGGDCPGKTELHRDILLRSDIFVEYPPQTRIEGEIQQLAADHPVTELWRVMTGTGRRPRRRRGR